ncbi:VWA domain-containing protein [Chitinophaga sp. Mgbs1]|uniref:VWA domain-containing protein n=1 Tax=Chitinophaga solisilvae TaxID=1233460 RepID=A0A3S1B1T2_9BACT|nr:VWA domain-containing protein [Chitinophaga solisilvae]
MPATLRHYLVHGTCDIKYTAVQPRTTLRLILLIDSSASMAAGQQISLVKGWVSNMLRRYRHQHPQVSLVALSHGAATLVSPFTSREEEITAALSMLRTGGKTNMAAGFETAAQLVNGRNTAHYQLCIFTDGRINAGYTAQPTEDAVAVFNKQLHHLRKQTYIINTETGYPRLGLAVSLSDRLGCSLLTPEH